MLLTPPSDLLSVYVRGQRCEPADGVFLEVPYSTALEAPGNAVFAQNVGVAVLLACWFPDVVAHDAATGSFVLDAGALHRAAWGAVVCVADYTREARQVVPVGDVPLSHLRSEFLQFWAWAPDVERIFREAGVDTGLSRTAETASTVAASMHVLAFWLPRHPLDTPLHPQLARILHVLINAVSKFATLDALDDIVSARRVVDKAARDPGAVPAAQSLVRALEPLAARVRDTMHTACARVAAAATRQLPTPAMRTAKMMPEHARCVASACMHMRRHPGATVVANALIPSDVSAAVAMFHEFRQMVDCAARVAGVAPEDARRAAMPLLFEAGARDPTFSRERAWGMRWAVAEAVGTCSRR